MMNILPRGIWAHIRSFSGDTGYEPTPTAKLLKDLRFIFRLPPENGGRFASTVVLSGDSYFLIKCRDVLANTLPHALNKQLYLLIFTGKEKDATNL